MPRIIYKTIINNAVDLYPKLFYYYGNKHKFVSNKSVFFIISCSYLPIYLQSLWFFKFNGFLLINGINGSIEYIIEKNTDNIHSKYEWCVNFPIKLLIFWKLVYKY